MNINEWKIIPWRFKIKYVLLKEMCKDLKIDTKLCLELDNNNIAKGIMFGINKTHLASYASFAFRELLKRHEGYCVTYFQPILIDRLSSDEVSSCQKNIFKYIIAVLLDEDTIILNNLIDYVNNSQNVPLYTVIKLTFMLNKSNCTEIRNSLLVKPPFVTGLNHINEDIRLATFSCFCREINDRKLMLIRQFLYDTVSYESTAFRNELMKEIVVLIINTQSYFSKALNQRKIESCDTIVNFFDSLVDFITDNLQENKYQNRRFALLILDIILRYYEGGINSENKMKGLIRKSTQAENFHKLKNYASIMNKWRYTSTDVLNSLIECVYDQSDDNRNLAQKLIKLYFLKQVYNYLPSTEIDNVNSLLKGHFYEIESGVLIYELILVCPEINCSKELTNTVLVNYLKRFVEKLKVDFFNVLKTENIYYGIFLLLNKFTEQLNKTSIDTLLNILNEVIESLLVSMTTSDSSCGQQVSPSFADMTRALTMILDSDEDELFSDEFQFILSSVWLNIKVSCDFISTIILNCSDNQKEHCLKLLQSVMQRTRHKGIIEAVGKALSSSVCNLTSTKNSDRELVDRMVSAVMDEIKFNKSHQSYTRRSAGLSIMLHRIVSGDQRLNKPTLTVILDTLFQILDTSIHETTDQLIFTGKDNSAAIALHCIRPLIHDASLWNYIKNYTLRIFKICFTTMSSKDWIVRNAGLQIYGVLTPKLIGQKDEKPMEEINKSTDKLFFFVLNIFSHDQSSTTIIEILYFLSRTWITVTAQDCFAQLLRELKNKVFGLLTISDCKIRMLAAKSYANLLTVQQIPNEIARLVEIILNKRLNANSSNGYLSLLKCLITRYKTDGMYIFTDEFIEHSIVNSLTKLKNSNCFFNRTHGQIDCDEILTRVEFNLVNLFNLGCQSWSLNLFDKIKLTDMNRAIEILIDYFETDVPRCVVSRAVESLCENDFREDRVDFESVQYFVHKCIYALNNYDSYVCLQIQHLVIKIILGLNKIIVLDNLDTNTVCSLFEKKFCIPLSCFLFVYVKERNENYFRSYIMSEIKYCMSDDIYRLQAAQSLLILAKYSQISTFLNNEMCVTIFNLFQVTDFDIRNTMSRFVLNLQENLNACKLVQENYYRNMKQFFTCLRILIPIEEYLKSIIFVLIHINDCHMKNENINKLNPFVHADVIIEDSYQRKFLRDLIKNDVNMLNTFDLLSIQNWFLDNYLENENYQKNLKNCYKNVNKSRSSSVFLIRDLLKIEF